VLSLLDGKDSLLFHLPHSDLDLQVESLPGLPICMRNYILKRLLAAVPTILGISIVIFLIMRLIPGDTISAMIGTQYKLTEAQAQSLRAYYGLDKSLPEQYFNWLVNALQGNLGLSVRAGTPVLNEILSRFPLTFELTILAMVIALIIGLPIAFFLREARFDSRFIRTAAVLDWYVPTKFLDGTLIIFVLSFIWDPAKFWKLHGFYC